jgi:tRNA threonylcarbamoyladenosine biosynthesis protein TsaE
MNENFLLAITGLTGAQCHTMKRTVITRTEEETRALAEELGKNAVRGSVFALTGELGAGKTIIAKGVARGMGITDEITSPTFTLMEIYEAPVPLYHFDLYRINREEELDQLFFEEYWEGDGVSVIEWADRAPGRLPDGRVSITIGYIDETSRSVTIEYPGD